MAGGCKVYCIFTFSLHGFVYMLAAFVRSCVCSLLFCIRLGAARAVEHQLPFAKHSWIAVSCAMGPQGLSVVVTIVLIKNTQNVHFFQDICHFSRKKSPAGSPTTDMGFLYTKSKIPRSKIPKSKNPKKYKILKSKIQHQKLKIHHDTAKIQYPNSQIEKSKNVQTHDFFKIEIRYFRRYSHII